MKYILFFILINLSTLYSQAQWFPAKYDSLTKKLVPDTSGAFPVSFIKIKKDEIGIYASMYGYQTNYETRFSVNKIHLYSDGLTIPINALDSLNRDYARAYYYFKYISKDTAELTIKRTNKRETIIFIKSTRPYRNINAKWG